jgi:RNA polymerase sigma-70 factor (ECF subfamily)
VPRVDPQSLAALLLSHVTGDLKDALEREADLGRRVEAWIAIAREAWPTIDVPLAVFVAYIAEHISPRASGSPDEINAADLYLVCACLRGEERAIALLEKEYFPELDRALARMQLGSKIEDIKQIVRARLLVARPNEAPKLVAYRGRGKLRAWLRVIAVREALDLLQKERHELAVDPDELPGRLVSGDNPELLYMKRTYRAAFKEAFEGAFLSLTPRAQNLLRQQLVDGLTVAELGVLYHVHHATAARWLVAARQELIKRSRKRLMQSLKLSPLECESVWRLAESQLEVSLSHLFRHTQK